jgi:hypothetical protein
MRRLYAQTEGMLRELSGLDRQALGYCLPSDMANLMAARR